VTLKLASGMTNPQRGKDLTDVEELIRAIPLAREFSERLNPYVQAKFSELWQRQQISGNRYLAAWRCPNQSDQPTSLSALLALDPSPRLQEMASNGIALEADLSQPGCVILSSHDRSVAAKFGMVDEFEVDLRKLSERPLNG